MPPEKSPRGLGSSDLAHSGGGSKASPVKYPKFVRERGIMKVGDFEERIWKLESIRVVVRTDRRDEVDDYDYAKAANENSRITEFLNSRVKDRVNGREVTVIRGDGTIAHGNTLLSVLRKSYSAK